MILKNLVALVCIVLCTVARAQDIFGDDRQAYILAPAEVISSGVVSQAEFSHSGRYITYRRQEIPNYVNDLLGQKIQNIYSWYRYDRNTKSNLKLAVPAGTQEVVALGDEQSIFFTGPRQEDSQGFLNIKSGVVTKTNIDQSSITYMGEEPNASYLVVKVSDQSIALVNPNGTSLTISVPQKLVVIRPMKSDAKSMTFVAMIQSSPAKFGHLTYKTTDGTSTFREITREAIQADMQPSQPEEKFMTPSVGDVMYVKTNVEVKAANPEIPPKAKLTMARSYARFSPNNDSIAYLASGALLIRDIQPIDADLAKQLAAVAAKQKAINDAKQAALSLIMFASDADDVLPGAEGWESKVLPYSQDMELLRRFNYTYRGGNMNNIESPATTEMGFILGPGGRAVAYCDGHVKWIPNP